MHRDLFIPSKSSSYVAATTLVVDVAMPALGRLLTPEQSRTRRGSCHPHIRPSPPPQPSPPQPALPRPDPAMCCPVSRRWRFRSRREGGRLPCPPYGPGDGLVLNSFPPGRAGRATGIVAAADGGRGRGAGAGAGAGAASSSPTLTPSIHGGRPSATVGAGRAPGGRAGLAGLEGAAGRRIGHGLCIVYNIYGDAGTDASCGLTRAASADLPSPSLPSLFPSFYLLAILLRLP